MAGPMHTILYIHNAILSEFRSLEETTKPESTEGHRWTA